MDILKIAIVVARQLGLFPVPSPTSWKETNECDMRVKARILVVGDLSYNARNGELPANLDVPFLQPKCNGSEKNLSKCSLHGLGTHLSQSCYEGKQGLYISALSRLVKRISASYFYFVEETLMNFADAKRLCQRINDIALNQCVPIAGKTTNVVFRCFAATLTV